MPSYTIGRFEILEAESYENRIRKLSWGIDFENIVTIEWIWPSNPDCKIALVFEVETTGNNLAELLSRNSDPEIITKSMHKRYVQPISGLKKQFRIYPAMFGEGDKIIVINQKSDNLTDVVLKKTRVDISVTYKPIFLSGYQKVTVQAKTEGDVSPRAIIYEKCFNNRTLCRYPLKNALEGSFFYIKKNESVKIKADEQFKDTIYIELSETHISRQE